MFAGDHTELTMMKMMMNCFCGMVDRRNVFSLISSWNHCQRSSPWWISDTLRGGIEPVQNLNSGFVEWSCPVVITTTSQCHEVSCHPSIRAYSCSLLCVIITCNHLPFFLCFFFCTIVNWATDTAQKMKFSMKDLFSKCDQIWPHSCRFGHIYWRNPWWKTSFFCAMGELMLFFPLV